MSEYMPVDRNDTSSYGEYAREHNARVDALKNQPAKVQRASVTTEELDAIMKRSDAQRDAARAAVFSGQYIGEAVDRSIRNNRGGISVQMGPQGTVVKRMGSISVVAEDPNPKVVRWNGMEMLREDAERQGWKPGGQSADPFVAAPEARLQPPQEQVQEQPKQPQEEAPSTAMTAATMVTNHIESTHGAEVMHQALALAADTGDFERAASIIPGGLPADMVQHIHDGFVDVANRWLRPLGVTANLLGVLLTEKEQAEARRATTTFNSEALLQFGERAQRRLMKMPTDNPEAFKTFVKEHLPDLKVRFTNGQALVPTGQGLTTWEAAVMSGMIRF